MQGERARIVAAELPRNVSVMILDASGRRRTHDARGWSGVRAGW